MDTTGCPEGFASDRVFLIVPLQVCGTSLAVFWAVTLLVSTLRFAAFLAKLSHSFKHSNPKSGKRKLFSLAVSLLSVFSYYLLAVLLALNIANAENGWSFTLYSLGYLPFIIDFTMMLFKIVRLGKGVIALPKRDMMGEVDYLTRFTTMGIFMASAQMVMAFVSTLTLIILSPVFPKNDQILGTIGFVSKGVFQMLCTFGIALQFQRCIRAIDIFLEQRKSTMLGSIESDVAELRMLHARFVLRQRQIFVIVFGGGVAMIFILLGGVIPWTWEWVMLGTAVPETFGHLLVEFVFNRKRRAAAKTSSVQGNQPVVSGKKSNGDEASYGEMLPVPEGVDQVQFPNKSSKGRLRRAKPKKRKPWHIVLSVISEERSTVMQHQSKFTQINEAPSMTETD